MRAVPLIKGVKTSEFLLTVVICILSLVMWVTGQIDSASAADVCKWAGGAYALARGLAKMAGVSVPDTFLPVIRNPRSSNPNTNPTIAPSSAEMLTVIVDSVMTPLAMPIISELQESGVAEDQLVSMAVERLRVEVVGNPRIPIDSVPEDVLTLAVTKALLLSKK